jgi:mRNA interferase MazF
LNSAIRPYILAPLSSTTRTFRSRVRVNFQGRDGHAVVDQIRTTDESRLVRRLGRLDDETGHRILRVLQAMFAV